MEKIADQESNWEFFDVPKLLKKKFPHNHLLLSEDQIKSEASKIVEIKGWNTNATKIAQMFNTYKYEQRLMKLLIEKKLPLIISTDGAHSQPAASQNSTSKSTTSAFVISMCNIKDGELLHSGQWLQRPTIPLLSRATALPSAIGNTSSDITTGELFAFALSELSLPPDLPRILITDSKSTRDLLMELRNTGNIDTDRIYTRKTAGGVSKFIFNLFQNRFLNLDNNNSSSSPDRIKTCLKESMGELNNFAKKWTSTDSSRQDEVSAKSTWDAKYWDAHDRRSIWKIDSHQLNEDGTHINKIPRYGKLIPNLGILSTNHHADVSADYVSNFNQKSRNIKIANSNLRFSLIWEGKTIDRHVSPFIKDKIDCERVKRLRLKPTQGLIWRIEQYTENIWKTFHIHKGLFRSMLGLSRSHTRCLYKNEQYRFLCKEVKLTQKTNPEDLLKLRNSTKSQDLIDILSPCMWCKGDKGTFAEDKGNRRHLFLHCNNDDIGNFREDTNKLLDQHLRSFFLKLAETTSWGLANQTLNNISNGFLHHQKHHTGRLSKVSDFRNNSYLSLPDLCLKWGQEHITDTIKNTRCGILLDIFGITPAFDPLCKGDKEIGLIDLPWLGIIPTFLNDILINACTNLNESCRPIALTKAISKQLRNLWEEIKALILGRAIGLHRVTGTTGKEMDKIFTERTSTNEELKNNRLEENTDRGSESLELRDQVESKIIVKRPCSSPSAELQKTKKAKINPNTIEKSEESKSNEQNPTQTSGVSGTKIEELKECQGVTCGSENIFWCQDSSFIRNKVKKGIRQCQRCGRFMTAMKQAKNCLSLMLQDANQDICNEIVSFCISNPHNLQFQYTSFMNLLDSYIGENEHPKKAKNTNKKTPERDKLICKIIHRAILHLTKQTDVSKDVVQLSANLILNTILKINQKHINYKDAKIIAPCTSLFESNSYITEHEGNTQTIFSSIHATSANSPNLYLSGGAISHAVKVLRERLTWNVFIAHADAHMNINNWIPNQTWSTFGRIFTSQRVIEQKPNDIYLIPFFSGRETSGHWHLIVIEKRRHFCEGWHIDSLGRGTEDRALQDKLQQAFLPGRGRFVWHFPDSTSQTECECGPRTIVAMDRIDKNIAMGRTTAIAIDEALLSHISEGEYNNKAIRLEAALLLETQVRNSNPRLRRPAVREPAQKKRRIRGTVKATPEVIELSQT